MKDQKVKKIIIIGAGISGLSSGIYGQTNGFQTEIFEKNPTCGGLCTTWFRKDFPVDGCIHWMTGTKKGTEINLMWENDLHAFEQEDIIQPTNFGTIEFQGKKLVLWCDLNRLEKEMLEISPKDKKYIKKFIKWVIGFQNMPLPTDLPVSIMSIWRFVKLGFSMFKYLPAFIYASNHTPTQFSNKFKSPLLRFAISHLVPGDGNLYAAMYAFGTVAVGNGGVIKGGSLSLANNLVQRYKEVGGIIHTCKSVDEIIIRNKKAVGIRLTNGEEHYADYIISAIDPDFTLRRLLKSKYYNHAFEKRYTTPHKNPVPSSIYASYAVDIDVIKKIDLHSTLEFDCPSFKVANKVESSLKIREYSYDNYFVKDGKTLLTVLIHQKDSDYNYWNNLHKNGTEYLKEKEKVNDLILRRLISHFPELDGHIEYLDMCTPKTYNKWTNAYHGGYMPFSFTNKSSIMFHNGKQSGVKNLQISSQWTVMPGGLPIAMMSGKFAIQRILHQENRFFKISKQVRWKYSK